MTAWSEPEIERLKALWVEHGGGFRKIAAAMGRTRGSIDGKSRVLGLQFHGGRSRSLLVTDAASVGAATTFPSRVYDPAPGILKSGDNQRKLGKAVAKGPWRGFPLFSLTLEERATCPRDCAVWLSCFDPDTLILTTAYSWKKISELQVGEKIVGFDEYPPQSGGNRKTKTATVEALGRAIQPSRSITTTRGEIRVSDKHLLLVKKGRGGYSWQEAGNISIGDQIQFLIEPWVENRSYESGRLRGFIEGEGYVTTTSNGGYPKSRIGWSQKRGDLIKEINDIARNLGFDIAEYGVISGLRDADMVLTDVKGGWREVSRFLGTIRPSRLLVNAGNLFSDHDLAQGANGPAYVTGVEVLGDIEVVTIKTSTATLIANGFCAHNCYGNNLGHAKRYRHGPALESTIRKDLKHLQRQHPRGFVVRLHILGDFYSVGYVDFWAKCLDEFPALHVFGYTARQMGDPIGRRIAEVRDARWGRFAIRTSGASEGPRTLVVDGKTPIPADALACPAQHPRLGKSITCASCALCWSDTAKHRPITFDLH